MQALASTSRVAGLGSVSLRAPRANAVKTCAVARPQVSSNKVTKVAKKASIPSFDFQNALYGTCGLLATQLIDADAALAKGGQFGILEGRTVALIHPLVMAILFGTTLYAGYLGWQWRRTRTVGTEIKELKAQLPAKDEEGNRPASPLDSQIKELEATRKELIAGGFRDKHAMMGYSLCGFGVMIAVEGCINTWTRTERLFPGPHLWAGAAIVVAWALATSLVPYMEKGNDNARTAHISLNALSTGLFIWQLPTGWEIVLKVFQFTSWP